MTQEETLWSGKPSKKFVTFYTFLNLKGNRIRFFGPLLLSLFFLFVIFFGLYNIIFVENFIEERGLGPIIFLLALFAVPLAVLWIYNTFLRKTYSYQITEKGVRFSGGVYRNKERHVSFSDISDVRIEQGMLEKMLGIARLNFYSLSESPWQRYRLKVSFYALEDPKEPKKIVEERINREG